MVQSKPDIHTGVGPAAAPTDWEAILYQTHEEPFDLVRNYQEQLAMIVRARDGDEIFYWGA